VVGRETPAQWLSCFSTLKMFAKSLKSFWRLPILRNARPIRGGSDMIRVLGTIAPSPRAFCRTTRRDAEWLAPLLDDQKAEVRHIAALRLAFDWPALADDTVLSRVIEAAADADWIWSWSDHFNNLRTGKEQALLALGKFGPRAKHAATLLQAEIALTERKVLELENAFGNQLSSGSVAENNLMRWEVDRDRHWINELRAVLRSMQE
jgi:hypothetical protein